MSTGGSPMETITVQLAELFQAAPLYSWVHTGSSYRKQVNKNVLSEKVGGI